MIFLATTLTFYIKMGYYCLVQILIIAYTIIVRPYEAWKDNVVEVMNDSVFVYIIVMLTVYDKKEDWSGARITTILNVLMIEGVLVSIIFAFDLGISIVKWCC